MHLHECGGRGRLARLARAGYPRARALGLESKSKGRPEILQPAQ